jgi:hypothetical protein
MVHPHPIVPIVLFTALILMGWSALRAWSAAAAGHRIPHRHRPDRPARRAPTEIETQITQRVEGGGPLDPGR